jgi:nucleoside-diphosphate kinase
MLIIDGYDIMTEQLTFSMIKPDAVKRNITGRINSYFEEAGLRIVAQKRVILTPSQAMEFYCEHKDKSFFSSLIENITAGPVILQVLAGPDAIALNRKIMGATNPDAAEPGTIRKDLAISIDLNSVHGSDSLESAGREISFFFSVCEILR